MKSPLTHLLRFLSSTGLARVQIVEDSQRDYDPAHDFYKKLRAAIVAALQAGNPEPMEAVLRTAHKKKVGHYTDCAEQVAAWMSKTNFKVLGVLASMPYTLGELKVNVSPELLLEVDGHRYIVKLYLAQEPLSPHALRALGFLIRSTFGDRIRGTQPAVLDVRKGKLRPIAESSKKRTRQWLLGEAAGFIAMWKGRAA